jgi:CDP-4-dehydro-6-deoxyglucose reductase
MLTDGSLRQVPAGCQNLDTSFGFGFNKFMAKTLIKTILTSLKPLTPTIRELTLKCAPGSELKFKTGQFAMMHIPISTDPEHPEKRAYSVASEDSVSSEFKLLVKLVPGGIASEFIRSLKEGSSVDFTGPFGKCLFLTPPAENALFLSTGAGLSQHFSMLISRGKLFPKTNFHLRIGVWNKEELFYQKELEALTSLVPKFTYEYFLDQGDGGWTGKTGFVTQDLKTLGISGSTHHVYLCGNPAMIKGAKQILLEEMGFPKENLLAEAFH